LVREWKGKVEKTKAEKLASGLQKVFLRKKGSENIMTLS
jgi:hypothetical protein